MEKLKFNLPFLWSMSEPVLERREQEMENLSSAGTFELSSKLRHWGLSSICISCARFHLIDKNGKKIKTVSSNFTDYCSLSMGKSIKLKFLIEVPRNVAEVRIEPLIMQDFSEIWYNRLFSVFMTFIGIISFLISFILILLTLKNHF